MRGFWTGRAPSDRAKEGAFRSRGNEGPPCYRCGLYKGSKHGKMGYSGGGRRRVLVIGEAPGKTEDERGIQFVGDSGDLFRRCLAKHGIDLHKDLWLINAVNCRPPKNRKPTTAEVAYCRGRVQRVISELQPEFIWLVGGTAVRSFYGGRFRDCSIGRWRGLCVPDKRSGAWVISMLHPSFALRSENDLNKVSSFERDVEFAVNQLDRDPYSFVDPSDMVNRLVEYEDVMRYLTASFKAWRTHKTPIAFDYETSNKKPYYGDTPYIWTCAISDSPTVSTAFPINYTGHFTTSQVRKIQKVLGGILASSDIPKIAHGLPFEDMWTRAVIGRRVRNWEWCTMNAAHVLDCRGSYCGLKFQSYINYGIEGYDKDAHSYMVKYHKGTQVNTLDTMPLDKLLLYNGIDALVTGWLYDDQRGRLTDVRFDAFMNITMPGLQYLSDASVYGISMDTAYYTDAERDSNKRLEACKKKLLSGDVSRMFLETTGRRLSIVNKDFSAKDLRIIVYDILGASKVKKTSTGLLSVDKESIEAIDHPWVRALVEWRRLSKIVGTYLSQFSREISSDGRMHPAFHLHTTRTYRSSSTEPNFQNIPNRDLEAKTVTRKGIIPSKGRRIAALDFGSHEVKVAACVSGDKKLIWYCSQDESDMHMDISTKVWELDASNIPKALRASIKSGFVFAEIYGSYYVNCAIHLWENCIDTKLNDGRVLKRHLLDVGIISGPSSARTKYKIHGKVQTVPKHLVQFIEHIRAVEKWFWGEFRGLREWQERAVSQYQRYGYVEMPFGFRRNDLMDRGSIWNAVIQGTAFHILMWAFNYLNRYYCIPKWKTKTTGQIHDEILYDLHDDELQEVLDVSEDVMVNKTREYNDWIVVPLVMEPEVTEIDGSWVDKKEMVRDGTTGLWRFKE